VGTQVNLSGSVTNLINRASDITNAFAHADFSQFESGVLYSNLIDYVDYDSIPSNFEYCVESVPMINEIVVSNELTVADAGSGTKTYSGKTDVLIECWYPFVVGAVLSFDLESAVDFSTGNIQPLNINHPPPTDSLGVPSAGSFKVIKLSTTLVPTTVATIPTVNIISKITLKVKSGADIVDQVISITITNTHDGGTDATTPSVSSMECLDPRFNLDGASTNQWRPESPSYTLYGYASSDGTNTWTKQYFSAFTTNCDNDGSMYVANHTLRSVAELGYLVYSTNAPWHTVKLYGPNLHRVLDVFGLSTNISDALMTNTVYRGLVNCNSNSAQDATAVVFADMPVDQYPDGSHSNTVMAGATVLVSRVYAGGFCTNLSDMGRNLNPSDLPGATELERESYFRNSVNLLNVRQNLFTIIIEAQVASGGNIPRNPVRQRAVALVWRDPYTGEMFVRSIKWLKD